MASAFYTATGASYVWAGTTTATNYQSQIWDSWITSSTTITTTGGNIVWQAWEQDDQKRDELQARREQASRERLARYQQQQEAMALAETRGLMLLDDLLTEEELASRWKDGLVQITGTDGQLYQLEMHRDTVHGNIVRTDEHGCVLGRACVAPSMRGENGVLPTTDGWVGQYLGLKFDTVEFLSHANWSQFRTCRQLQQLQVA